MDGLAGERGRLREHGVEVDRAGHQEHSEDAEREPEIADAVDDECLDRRRVRFGLLIPEADEQIAHQADALPAEKQLHEIVRRHQHQHGEGEQRQVREEPRPERVVLHVADRIEMDEGGDGGDDDQHHRGERVDAQRPVDFEVAGDDPREQRAMTVVMAEADIDEGEPRQQHGCEQKDGGHELGRTRARRGRHRFGMLRMRAVRRRLGMCMADVGCSMIMAVRGAAWKTRARAGNRDQCRDDGAEERQENDRVIHPQPFIRLMSSTAIEPRLR